MAASATFALKVAVWFRRGRLFMVSPDSLGTACPLSGRNSTYRSVQISETSSDRRPHANRCPAWPYPIHATEARFVREHDTQLPVAPGGSPAGLPHSIRKAV